VAVNAYGTLDSSIKIHIENDVSHQTSGEIGHGYYREKNNLSRRYGQVWGQLDEGFSPGSERTANPAQTTAS